MKNFIIAALAIGCIYLFFFYKAPINKTVISSPTPEVEAYVKADVEEINQKITKKGFDVAVLEEVQNSIQDISLVRDSAKAFKDSILNDFNKRDRIKDKQIESLTQYATAWRDSFMMATKSSDTTFKYANNGLKIEFVSPYKSKPYFNYQYDANINYLEYWDKKHLLARKKEYIDFWIEDTRATVKGVKRLKIEKKQDPFKLNINASSFYYDRLNIGVDAQATIGRYNLGGGYYYDVENKSWRPIFSLKFNIMQF